MSISNIYSKILWILMSNFSVKERGNPYNADLLNDLGLGAWDINLLLYLVESNFNVKLLPGVEQEIKSLNQLATIVYSEIGSKEEFKQTA